jgi:hypothetical protein
MPKATSSPKDEEQPMVAHLKVLKSHIKVDGTCRVPESVLPLIDVEEKGQLAIHFDGESILCTMFADHMISEGHIKLRSEDMEKLGVKEGDSVVVASRKDMKEHEKALKEMQKEEKNAKKAAAKSKKAASKAKK